MTREQILEERRQLKAKFGELYPLLVALLFRHDPIGINFEVNPDEYDLETCRILPRLSGCESSDAVQRVVHEEFARSFDAVIAGPRERYSQVASEIWQLWQAHRETHSI